MQRLLGNDDLAFISAQPAFGKSCVARFRKQRARLFVEYLRGIAGDFDRMHRTAKLLLMHGAEDRSNLVNQLALQRIIFSAALLRVHWKVFLYRQGWTLPEANIASMIDAVESMRSQVHEMLVQPAVDAQ